MLLCFIPSPVLGSTIPHRITIYSFKLLLTSSESIRVKNTRATKTHHKTVADRCWRRNMLLTSLRCRPSCGSIEVIGIQNTRRKGSIRRSDSGLSRHVAASLMLSSFMNRLIKMTFRHMVT